MAKRKQEDDLFPPVTLNDLLKRASKTTLAPSTRPVKKARHTNSKQPAQQKECIICAEELPITNFPSKIPHHDTHSYTVCTDCWQTHLSNQIESKPTSQISCPQCFETLQEPKIKALATKTTHATYLDKMFQETLQNDPDYRTCPSSTCTFGYIMTQDDDQSDSIFNCRVCEAQYCVRCEVPMHKGQSCKEYRAQNRLKKQRVREEKASTEFLKDYAKKCPKCKVRIRKAGGCDHMTCGKCKHEFCWLCSAPYNGTQGIHRVGNAAHKRKCNHHPDMLPTASQDAALGDEDDDSDDDELPPLAMRMIFGD